MFRSRAATVSDDSKAIELQIDPDARLAAAAGGAAVGAPSLREVIAFPKTAKAIDLMVDAPTPVSDAQLQELHLRIASRS